MMTDYQKQKLDELIKVLREVLSGTVPPHRLWYVNEEALRLAEGIRDHPEPREAEPVENSAKSSIMDDYLRGKRLELFQSIDGTPFVCPGDDVYECTGITLDRFVELLAMRQSREAMSNKEEK